MWFLGILNFEGAFGKFVLIWTFSFYEYFTEVLYVVFKRFDKVLLFYYYYYIIIIIPEYMIYILNEAFQSKLSVFFLIERNNVKKCFDWIVFLSEINCK